MKAYQNNSFQDRVDQVAKAKQRLIEKLRDKPEVDPAAEEARAGRKPAARGRPGREACTAQGRGRSRRAGRPRQQGRQRRSEAARLAAIKPELTEEERKQARDARYAARKKRR